MTTTSINPAHYLKHAWENTKSVWGKACIVLFYTFIWFQIVWAVQLVIAPLWGWDCFRKDQTDYAVGSATAYLRAMNVYALGFYLYADRGGIRLWNVTMVFLVNFFATVSLIVPNVISMDGAPKGCEVQARNLTICMWLCVAWTATSLVTSLLEALAAEGGSAENYTPLNQN